MSNRKAKILVVDDSPTALRITGDSLTEEGYHVWTAADGEEALEAACRVLPDLVVLDIVLPKMNGFQVCRQLKTDPRTKSAKVVMLSSKNQDSDKFWGQRQGADAYVTKPFEDEELCAVVARLLGGRPAAPQPAAC
jgi:twitching motility two-component system response regulator PilH